MMMVLRIVDFPRGRRLQQQPQGGNTARACLFSTHMGKCTNTLLEMASQIKDQQVRS